MAAPVGRVFHRPNPSAHPVGGAWEKERVTYVGAHPAGTASRLRRGVATITGVALAGAFIAYGGAASATPNPTASQVRAKISKLMSQLDAVSQQYDQSITDLKAATARLKMINRHTRQGQAQARYDARRRRADRFRRLRAGQPQLCQRDSHQRQSPGRPRPGGTAQPSVHGQARAVGRVPQCREAVLQSAQQQTRTTAAISQLKTSKQAQYKRLKKLIAKNQAELNKLTAPPPFAAATRSSGSAGAFGSSGRSGGGIIYQRPGHGRGALGCGVRACPRSGRRTSWGGTGPYYAGYDCSGLVMAAWAQRGVQIPRTTYDQWAALPHVSTADMQPGDLHVLRRRRPRGHVCR